ncbi:hypothetical protein DENIS_1889 [Desulfonema ishimotonii]|uniref:Glycosyltransferase family 1 protein n=1 Tax=Desulfonema ishimotonii TaxID=45657 RepID=A0A401FVD9_9BACT|nr:glycosyltransferase [Desulfonema ishimotonii]GBC60929.1 hypothetical protein DENIS_1889 [Desulfonema ishimotonii]
MNILIFSTNSKYSDYPVGGAETSLRLIAEKFAAIGENVVYVTQSRSKLPSVRVRMVRGVSVYEISPLKWPSFGGWLFQGLKERFARWQLLFFLVRIIRKEKIDIIHTYSEYPDTFDVLRIREKFFMDFKVVIRIAGLGWRGKVSSGNLKKEIEWVINQADAVNFISEGSRDLVFEEMGKLDMQATPRSQVVMDIGFNNNVFSRKWVWPAREPFQMAMVASFNYNNQRQKRQDLLVEAMHLLRDRNMVLHFMGQGANFSRIRDLAGKYGLEDRVIFHGYVSQRKLEDILVASHLFCLATNHEGVPKSMLEAMALGVPSIVSDVRPLNSYIQDTVNGFLCPNTPHAWAGYISDIADGRYDLRRISDNGVGYIKEKYIPDENIITYRSAFLRLLRQSSSERFCPVVPGREPSPEDMAKPGT